MRMRAPIGPFFILCVLAAAACEAALPSLSSAASSSTQSPPAANVQPVSVNPGPNGDYVNGIFTSVTLCIPGTSECQTIGDVLVDTGSFGLRVQASALNLSPPPQTDAAGNPIGECVSFAAASLWGPVATVDVRIAGERARDLPIQIIGAPDFPSPPEDCADSGLPPADSVQAMGANGILGVGLFAQDCGDACATGDPSNPGLYYSCPATDCSMVPQPLQHQVENPVARFSSDNNGVVIDLPAVGADGAATAAGSMIFGIGTRLNNRLGAARVYTANDVGNFTTVFDGSSYTASFIDSGSNGLFFLNQGVTDLARCHGDGRGFYCPADSLSFDAVNVGQNGASATVTFSVANAQQLFSTGNAAFSDLGGVFPGAFDWGAPFFFGRKVFVAINGRQTPAGPGPYWAY